MIGGYIKGSPLGPLQVHITVGGFMDGSGNGEARPNVDQLQPCSDAEVESVHQCPPQGSRREKTCFQVDCFFEADRIALPSETFC